MNAWLVAALLDYSSPSSYAQPVIPEGGGGGRWFTGSPADGFDCSVCHGDGQAIELDIVGVPTEGWSPGLTYELWIRSADPSAHVSFLAEFAGSDGTSIGLVELPPNDLLQPEERCSGGPRAAKIHTLDQDRQVISFDDCGAKLLRMQWTAPAVAERDAWLYVAGVHADASEDPHGDGVMVERIRLPAPATDTSTSGCTIGEPGRGNIGLALLGLLALGLTRSRARATLIGLMLFASACARVQPHERGRLAAPDMQMELDAEMCAGRTHAVEYREGSAGGFGGGGGGCGCN